MTKTEFMEALKAKQEKAVMSEAETIKQAEDTIPEVKVVNDVKAAEGMPHEEIPTQKEVAKEVAAAVDPVVAADKDGVSKNGGEEDLTDTSVEAEKKKEDSHMKDAINVTERTFGEQVEVNNELLTKLAESEERNAKLIREIKVIKEAVAATLAEKTEAIKNTYIERMTDTLKRISEKGNAIEEALVQEADEAKKTLKLAEAYGKASLKLNKILVEGLKSRQEPKKMLCVESYKARISGRAKRFGN